MVDSSVDCPPKFKLRGDFSCFMRYHREYITFYNFEAIIVKYQSLYI